MTPDHLAILIDLFLKACGVVLLGVIAWRWKFDRAPKVQRFYATPRRYPVERLKRMLNRPEETIILPALTMDRGRK